MNDPRKPAALLPLASGSQALDVCCPCREGFCPGRRLELLTSHRRDPGADVSAWPRVIIFSAPGRTA